MMVRQIPNRCDRSEDDHLNDRRLAELASGVAADPRDEVHLATCRVCAAAYAELRQIRTQDLAGELQAPEEILATGHDFVTQRVTRNSPTGSRTPTPVLMSPSRRRGQWRLASAAALAASLLLFLGHSRLEETPKTPVLPEAIRAALIRDSSYGLVHPLVADAQAFDAPALRGPDDEAFAVEGTILDDLQVRLSNQPSSAELATLVISAFQAAGQQRNAREFLDAARARHPLDSRLEMLEVIQDYREGDLTSAEALLRSRMQRRTDDELSRLNLAILLRARGDP